MTPQTPAQGILLTRDFGKSKFYTVVCSCGNPDDEIGFEVSAEDGNDIVINTWTVQKTSWWDDPFKQNSGVSADPEWWWTVNYRVRGFLNSLAHRIKITWNVWINGYVRYDQFMMMDKQQALNYAETLKQAIADLEKP